METKPAYSIIRRVGELASSPLFPVLDLVNPSPNGSKYSKRHVDRLQGELRRLHEELNAALYSCKASERPVIGSSIDAAGLFIPFMGNLDHEELWIALLNTRNRVLHLVKLYQGSVNCSQVRVGECFQAAIINKAAAIIVAHNHPSGDPTPSPDDVGLTRAIVQAGKLLDIEVLDHIIVACSGFISLKERGLGFT